MMIPANGSRWPLALRLMLILCLSALALAAQAGHHPWDQAHDIFLPVAPPDAGPEDRPECDPCSPGAMGSPVYVSAGHALWTSTDVVLRGRPYMGVVRSYNSNDPVIGLFGNGWTVDFDIALYPANSGGVVQRIYKAASGKRFVYVRQNDGTFKPPASRFESIVEGPSTVTMTSLDGRRHVFAKDGRLLERYDTNNNRILFTHDSAARPIHVEDGNGRTLDIVYNGAGLVDSVRDHTNRIWRYTYDSTSNLIAVTDPTGAAMRYAYQAYKPAGDAHIYQQLLSVADATGVYDVRYTYSGNRVASYTEGANVFTYVRNGTNTKVAGTVTRTDSLGARTILVYGSQGLVTQETDGLNNVTSFAYDSNGKLIRTTDALLRNWQSTFDSLGRMTSTQNPLGQATTVTYQGEDPRPITVKSPSNRTVSMTYDTQGNLKTTTDATGAVTQLSYNSRGDLTSVKNALNQTTSITYSTRGLPLTVTDALGRVTTMSYDSLGRMVQQTNPAGETTQYAYDLMDRVVSITDPLAQVTTMAYNAAGRLLSVTDAKGSVTQYEYDSYGRRVAEVAPDNRRTQYTYRLDNLLDRVTAPDNTTIIYAYDANKRVTRETAGSEITNYTYNTVNQLLTASSTTGGTVVYTYDDAGRVATETSGGSTNVITRNADGERTQLSALGVTQSYTRDKRGLITRIASSAAGTFDFNYDKLGRRTKLTYPTGATATYGYDTAGQLTSLSHAGAFNAPYAYTHDLAGRITRITGDGPDWNYTYDTLGRLRLAVQDTQSYSYTLDAVGNILEGGRTYDVNHRLVSDAAKTYGYDLRGNLTLERDLATGARVVYIWNNKNQLKQLDFYPTATGPTPSRRLLFTYDPLGRRASKNDNGLVQQFVYDGMDLFGILDGAGSISSTHTFTGQVDEPLSSTSPASTQFLHANHLGTVTTLTSGGTISASYGYGPYGETIATSSPDTIPFRYTGREKDTESIYFHRARYYITSLPRFAQTDPIGLTGGINTYAYVGGNPINYTDPTGECPWCVAVGIGALTDLAVQLYFNGFNIKCVNWTEVAVSGAAAGLGVGIAQKLGKVSTAYGGANRPTYRFFQSKGNFRIESHPISRNAADWNSYPHWHPDFAGKPWSKMHWPLIEPVVGLPAAAYNATGDNCECQN